MSDLEDLPILPDSEDYDTSDKESVNKARKKSSRTRADRLKFVEAAMTMEQGRAWFYDLLIFCHVFNTTFDEDPYRHAYRTGEANIGLRVLSDIQETSPQNYIKMIAECKSKKE
jgi:hypothetical protein